MGRDNAFHPMAATFLVIALATPGVELDAQVRTESGLVSGAGTEVIAYKGIPYAAPPTGPLRWRPPKPAAPWEGVRASTEFGPVCAQGPAQLEAGLTPSEDCLSLNIWTLAPSPNDRRPVMVWIHGGGFVGGSGADGMYDGANLARQGVVVVTLNYRLGVFGFLAHPQLTAESEHKSSGNYGILDQIAALQWVQRNIAQFGGDPARVTIFGESAGGASVTYLLLSPLSAGLFQRAIVQSPGGINAPIAHRSEVWFGKTPIEEAGKALGHEIAELRALSVGELLRRAAPEPGAAAKGDFGTFVPSVDGWIIPDEPGRMLRRGRIHDVPVLTGANADEGTLFTAIGLPFTTVAAYRAFVATIFGPLTGKVMVLYPAATDNDVKPAFTGALTDFGFVNGSRAVAQGVARRNGRAYQYFFTRVNSLGRGTGYGAFHGAEINYVFGNLSTRNTSPGAAPFNGLPTPDADECDRKLAELMSDAWVRFATSGDPNGGALPAWPRWNRSDAAYLEFGDSVRVERGLRREKLDIFDGMMRIASTQLAPAPWSGFVGVGVFALPQYLGSDRLRVVAVPLVNLDRRRKYYLSIATTGIAAAAGANLVRSPALTVSATLGAGDSRHESRGDGLAGMGDRGAGISASVAATHRRGPFVQSATIIHGLNNHAGLSAVLGGGIDVPLGFNGLASARALGTVVNAREMRYDFGIDATQATRRQALIDRGDSRLRPGETGPFAPTAGLQSVGANLSVTYLLSEHLTTLTVLSATRLVGSTTDSPLVRLRTQPTAGLGFGYRF